MVKETSKEKYTDESVIYLYVITNTFPLIELLPFLITQETVTFWEKVVLLQFPGQKL